MSSAQIVRTLSLTVPAASASAVVLTAQAPPIEGLAVAWQGTVNRKVRGPWLVAGSFPPGPEARSVTCSPTLAWSSPV